MRGARGLTLLLVSLLALFPAFPASAQPPPDVLLIVVQGLTYDEVLSTPVLARLAGAGGLGLLTRPPGQPGLSSLPDMRPALPMEFLQVGEDDRSLVRHAVATLGSRDVLVLVGVASQPGVAGPTPLVVARGAPRELLAAEGPPGGLTSDTTRRAGLVAMVDVAPTILAAVGRPIPEGSPGSPIRIEGFAPSALAERFTEYRRVVTPVGVAVLLFAVAPLVVGVGVLLWPGAPRRLAGAVAVWTVLGISATVALLPGSWLPSFDLPVVIAAILVVAVAVAAAALRYRRPAPMAAVAPVAVVAGVGLVLVGIDAALGWRALLTPLMGGSALDGVRFFGLGNSYAGVVLAGAVLVAALLRPWAGVALLAAAALFAGLPFLGADVGGSLTMFAVAGLWWGLRVRGRPDVLGGVTAGVVTAAGLGVLVLTHRLWPVSGHLTGAVAEGPVGALARRLALNYEVTAATPSVWPVLLLLPVGLAVAWTRVRPFTGALQAHPGWRDGVLLLAVGGMMGWVLNDTYGMATVAVVFLAAALVYPALEARWRRS